MTISRRALLRAGGLAVGALALPRVALGRRPGPTLVWLYLRGGADGAGMIVPAGEPWYRDARPTIGLRSRDLIDFSGRLGLHPAWAPVLPLWREGRITAAVGVGLPDTPPGHEDARRTLERTVPTLSLRDAPPCGPALPQLARLIREEAAPPVVSVTLSGWDTHIAQGGASGRLARQIGALARVLAAFTTELGPLLEDVVVVTVTEFGRAVGENAHGGTDHGQASAAMVLGGREAGGRVVGRWAPAAGGGFAPTVDVRELVADVVTRHAGTRARPRSPAPRRSVLFAV